MVLLPLNNMALFNPFLTSHRASLLAQTVKNLPPIQETWVQSLVWSCCPRDSQESSPAPQLESLNSLVLSLLYGPTRTSIHDYWKNNSSEYTKHHVSALTNGNSSQCILSLFYAFMLLNSSSTCAQGHFLYQSAQVQLDPEPKMLISTLCFTFFSLLLFPLYLFFLRLSPPS